MQRTPPPPKNVRSYANVTDNECSPKAPDPVEARRAQDDLLSIYLDLDCPERPDAPITDTVVADFIFDELRLKSDEFVGIVRAGSGQRSVKIETVRHINVAERFGEDPSFVRVIGGSKWSCILRGGERSSPMRFFNVPRWVTNQDLITTITPFAKALGPIEKELFGKLNDPRLKGHTTGHRRVQVVSRGPIPDFISIGSRKFRIYHRDQAVRCFVCRKEGHMKAECPSVQDQQNPDEVLNLPNESEESVPSGLREPTDDESVKAREKENAQEHLSDVEVTSNEVTSNKHLEECIANVEDKTSPEPKSSKSTEVESSPADHESQSCNRSKRKVPETQTTPIAKDVTENKKKGRKTNGLHLMSTRSTSSS